jgi:hypothetical protein
MASTNIKVNAPISDPRTWPLPSVAVGAKVKVKVDVIEILRADGQVRAVMTDMIRRMIANVGVVTGYYAPHYPPPWAQNTQYLVIVWDNGDRAEIPEHYVDVMTETPTKARLHDNCPKCGHQGSWVRMALMCPTHGVWAGC